MKETLLSTSDLQHYLFQEPSTRFCYKWVVSTTERHLQMSLTATLVFLGKKAMRLSIKFSYT